jgi:hypothetical protein
MSKIVRIIAGSYNQMKVYERDVYEIVKGPVNSTPVYISNIDQLKGLSDVEVFMVGDYDKHKWISRLHEFSGKIKFTEL